MANYSDPIRIWAYGDYVEAANEAVKIYKRDVDPDVNVQITAIELSELDAHLKAALQARTPPDIVLMDDKRVRRYLGEFSSSFVPLNDYIDQSGIYFNFMPYKMEKITYDNQIYGVPYSASPAVLWYREDILDAEGISIDDLSTWDRLREFGEQLRETGKYLLPPLQCFDMEIFLSSIDGYLDESGNSNVGGIQEAMRQLRDLYNESFIYPSTPDLGDVQGALYAAIMEGVPVFIGGVELYLEIKKISASLRIENWRVAPFPKSELFANDVGLCGHSWLVTNTGNQDKAVDFMLKTFATSTELAVGMAEKHTIIPVFDEALVALNTSDDFEEKELVRFLAELGWEIPERQQKIFTLELESCFKYWLNEVIYNEFPVDGIESKFNEICSYLSDLDPGKYYETLFDIYVSRDPDKMSYVEGETFDNTGMRVFLEGYNCPSGVITGYTYSPTGPLSAGTQAITVSYSVGDITKSNLLWLDVASKSLIGLNIEQVPNKMEYKEKECFDKTGMKVRVFYNNNTSELVEDYTYSPISQLTMKSPQITVSYTRSEYSATVTFPITVTTDVL